MGLTVWARRIFRWGPWECYCCYPRGKNGKARGKARGGCRGRVINGPERAVLETWLLSAISGGNLKRAVDIYKTVNTIITSSPPAPSESLTKHPHFQTSSDTPFPPISQGKGLFTRFIGRAAQRKSKVLSIAMSQSEQRRGRICLWLLHRIAGRRIRRRRVRGVSEEHCTEGMALLPILFPTCTVGRERGGGSRIAQIWRCREWHSIHTFWEADASRQYFESLKLLSSLWPPKPQLADRSKYATYWACR